MNSQLLTTLGIDANGDLKTILDQLEDKQYEYLERAETANAPERKKEIEDLLSAIDKEITAVKEEIKTVSSSLILDTGATTKKEEKKTEAKKKEEEKKAKAEKEAKDAQLENKIAQMKNKEAEKQAKEAEKKQKEAEKQAQSQSQQQNAQTIGAPSGGNASGTQKNAGNNNAAQAGGSYIIKPPQNGNQDYEYNKALIDYKKGDHKAAFPVFKKYAEQGDVTMQALVAHMYMKGQGTDKDYDRGMFWMKKAAKGGDRDSQSAYGANLLVNSNGNRKEIKEGFKFLQMAADTGDVEAMKFYVDAALKNYGDRKEIKKAIKYCDQLKATDTDSFNREQYATNKQQLKVLKKGKKGKFPWGVIIFIIIVILGCRGCVACSGLGEYFDKAEEASESEEIMSDEEYPSESVEPVVQEIRIRITASSANIRSGAGTDYGVVGTGAAGEEFVTTGNTQATSSGTLWYEIYLDEARTTTGWASQKVLEVIE